MILGAVASGVRPKRAAAPQGDVKEALVEAMRRLDAARVKRLLDSPAGAALTKRDLGGLLFHANPNASAAKQAAVMRLVLARGADPDVKDEDDEPLVAHIAYRMAPAVLRVLLAHGADPDAERGRAIGLLASGPDKQTPAKLKLLVEAGADINARPWPADNDNALTFAISTKDIDLRTCRALIELGIDLNAKNRHGETALDAAEKAGLTAIAALIRARGGRHGRSAAERTRPTQIEKVLYARAVARAKSPHASGLPVRSLYKTEKALGGRFPGCAFPPKHLVSFDLRKLPFPPAVKRVGVLHVVHVGCQDCAPDDYTDYSIGRSGTLSPHGETARRGRGGCTTPLDPDYTRPIGVQLVASEDTIPREQALAIEVGGAPRWHQAGHWPGCDKCGLPMFFIAQIGGSERLYVFLCERCRVMTTIRQID